MFPVNVPLVYKDDIVSNLMSGGEQMWIDGMINPESMAYSELMAWLIPNRFLD